MENGLTQPGKEKCLQNRKRLGAQVIRETPIKQFYQQNRNSAMINGTSGCPFEIPDLLAEEATAAFQQLVKAVVGMNVSLVSHGPGHPLAVACLALPQRTTTICSKPFPDLGYHL